MPKKKKYNGIIHNDRVLALLVLSGESGAAAYKSLHPKASQRTAESNSFKILNKTDVKKFLDERRALLCNKAEKKAEDIIGRLEEIGFAEVKDQKKKFGKTFKFSDSVKSVIALGDYHGLFNHDKDKDLTKVEITIRNAANAT